MRTLLSSTKNSFLLANRLFATIKNLASQIEPTDTLVRLFVIFRSIDISAPMNNKLNKC